MVDLSIYGGRFAVALVAATLFPLQSEALLAGLLIAGKQPVWMLVAVASVGNGDRKNGTLCGDRFLAYDVTRLAAAVRPLAWLT